MAQSVIVEFNWQLCSQLTLISFPCWLWWEKGTHWILSALAHCYISISVVSMWASLLVSRFHWYALDADTTGNRRVCIGNLIFIANVNIANIYL